MKRRYLEMMSDLGVNTAFEDPPPPLAQTNHFWAVNTYRMLAEEKANVCFSPITISATMAMLLCAADGKMKYGMKTAFGHRAGLKADEIAPTTKKQKSTFLENPDCYTLHTASCMLSQKELKMKERYKQMLTESFEAPMLEFDFETESEKAVKQVNEWVKEKTNNSITQVMDSLDRKTVTALLNAVYFKGTWKMKFKEEAICPEKFHCRTTGVKQVDMMHIRNFFYFHENESFKILQLPYNGEDLCMLIVLPHDTYDLKSVENRLTASFLRDMTDKLWGLEVEIALPRFRLECISHLIPCIRRLGVHLGVDGLAFSRGDEVGACCGLLKKSPDVAVSDFSHKAVLEVSEDGTDAEEVTVMRLLAVDPKKPSPPKTFVADHPFLYIIFDTSSEQILLMGRVSDL